MEKLYLKFRSIIDRYAELGCSIQVNPTHIVVTEKENNRVLYTINRMLRCVEVVEEDFQLTRLERMSVAEKERQFEILNGLATICEGVINILNAGGEVSGLLKNFPMCEDGKEKITLQKQDIYRGVKTEYVVSLDLVTHIIEKDYVVVEDNRKRVVIEEIIEKHLELIEEIM